MQKGTKLAIHSFIKSLSHMKVVAIGFSSVAITIIVCLILPEPQYTDGFKTISELEEFANTLNENIKIEGATGLNPIYDKFYATKYSFTNSKKIFNQIRYIFFKLGLINAPAMSENFFKNLLIHNINTRIASQKTDNFFEIFTIDHKAKVVVFGPTQGAFHSLTRYLKKLKELKIISENFKITQPNYFIVFLGNVVNRSPYTIEIFSIVLKLLIENPNNVIYLRGTHEQQDIWKNQTLGREVELLFKAESSNKYLFIEKEINRLFNTLPISIFCKVPTNIPNKYNFFQISPYIEDEVLAKNLKTIEFSSFLEEINTASYKIYKLDKIDLDKLPLLPVSPVKAIITGIKKRDFYENMDGLRLLSYIDGILTWTTLSSASEVYQIGLKYFHEAFTIIHMEKERWYITLFKRHIKDVNSKDFQLRTQDFFSGEIIKDNSDSFI